MAEEIAGAEAEAEEQETVLGDDATDAEIDSLSEEEVNSLLDEVATPSEEEEKEEVEPEEKPAEEKPAEKEKPAEEEKSKEEEKPAEEEKSAEEEKPEEKPAETTEEKVVRLETQNQELAGKVDRQGKQLGRWSNEIGEMRKLQETLDKPKMTDEEFARRMEENPREAIREEQEHATAEADKTRVEGTRLRNESEDRIRKQLPDFDDLLPDIVEIARKRYDLEDWAVEEIKKDPFTFDTREILDIARDVKLQRLQAKLDAAETETEPAKPKPKTGKGNLSDKINKASKKPPRLAGGSGQAGEGASSADAEDLSDEFIGELDEKAVNKMLKDRGVPV